METSSSIYLYSPYPYKKKVQKKARNILYTLFFIIYKKKTSATPKNKNIYLYYRIYKKEKKKHSKVKMKQKNFVILRNRKNFNICQTKLHKTN